MKNNVNFNRARPCTGCGACAAICPTSAIKMIQNKKGFYIPYIDESLCIECGKCKSVCYSHIDKFFNSENIQSKFGFLLKTESLYQSASGGVGFYLSQILFKEGYTIIGCAYNYESNTSEHIAVKNEKDLEALRGSKYFQSNSSIACKLIRNSLPNTKFAIFGTPCQIYGFKLLVDALKKDINSFVFIEIFCHGVTSPYVWQKYLDYMNKNNDQIEHISFRSKKYGWHLSCNEIQFKNRTIITKRVGDPFFEVYYSKKMFNEPCFACLARKNLGIADIRIGDFWGQRFQNDSSGVSCILSMSEKGTRLIQKIDSKDFAIDDANLEEILKSQSYQQTYERYIESENALFDSLLSKNSFRQIIKILRSNLSVSEKVKKNLYIFLSNIKHKYH